MPPSRRSVEDGLIAAWRRRGLAASLLFPFSLLFRALVAARRAAYGFGLMRQERLPVPVIVVGNITVGGSGKTPLVIHLANNLRERGLRPGIITRGYRGSATAPTAVQADDDVAVVGDEAVLLARSSGCPVYIGRDRVAAGRALLARHPACNLIISDDGLQHYRMERDVELAVLDRRGLMNGWCLPAGPLREPRARLAKVDAVILNDDCVMSASSLQCPVFRMDLEGAAFRLLGDPEQVSTVADLAGKYLHAVAGIGAPGRFFEHLSGLGLQFAEHPFPDHHAYTPEDLEFAGDAILTTEKDAVKLEPLNLLIPVWVLPVVAHLTPALDAFVLEKLHGCPPA